jgi:hypothetical protein
MATQAYCTIADVEELLSVQGATAFVDDDETGSRSTAEAAFITSMIGYAAERINFQINQVYVLADVVNNGWLNYANAYLAAGNLIQRRGMPLTPSLSDQIDQILDQLSQIVNGSARLPQQVPSFDTLPTVSNFKVDLSNANTPTPVNVSASTGPAPVGNRKRFTS